MTDLFRGYDLTVVADKVAQACYERDSAAAKAMNPDHEPIGWENLTTAAKFNFKSSLLPIITDVLDALESDQVKPREARQMVEYGYDKGDRKDPRFYENQDNQHDTATATVWALHIRVPEEWQKQRILERMAVLPEPTGEYTYGDSWRQWCEPSEGPEDVRLCIYFHATPDRAAGIGQHLAMHATFACAGHQYEDIAPYAVSTSGDYAEQLEVP